MPPQDITRGRSAGTVENPLHDPTRGRSAGRPENPLLDPTRSRAGDDIPDFEAGARRPRRRLTARWHI